MGWLDILIVTLINAIACISLPRLLALVQMRCSPKNSQPSSASLVLSSTDNQITRFPYCTSHIVTGKQSCRFAPQFCATCSSVQ